MSTESNKELVRRITEEGMNKGNTDFGGEVFATDYRVHGAGLDLPPGKDGFFTAMTLWRTAFPDFRVEIEELVGEGDLVANRFHTTGTHTGPLFGVAPTGRTFEVRGTDMHRIVGGKVVESWISDDVPRIVLELGIGDQLRHGSRA